MDMKLFSHRVLREIGEMLSRVMSSVAAFSMIIFMDIVLRRIFSLLGNDLSTPMRYALNIADYALTATAVLALLAITFQLASFVLRRAWNSRRD